MKTTYVSPHVFNYGNVADIVQFKFGPVRDFWFLRRRRFPWPL